MTVSVGIKEIDVHGLRKQDAMCYIWRTLKNLSQDTYQLSVIHGYNHGNVIKNAIWNEFNPSKSRKVKNIRMGCNEGVTTLVLRELY